jgi:hypothetical protein
LSCLHKDRERRGAFLHGITRGLLRKTMKALSLTQPMAWAIFHEPDIDFMPELK